VQEEQTITSGVDVADEARECMVHKTEQHQHVCAHVVQEAAAGVQEAVTTQTQCRAIITSGVNVAAQAAVACMVHKTAATLKKQYATQESRQA
jgi:hypothetical protein